MRVSRLRVSAASATLCSMPTQARGTKGRARGAARGTPRGTRGAAKTKASRNDVQRAVDKAGGVIKTCALLEVSNATLFRWMASGSIPSLGPALVLSKASGVPVERFAGLER